MPGELRIFHTRTTRGLLCPVRTVEIFVGLRLFERCASPVRLGSISPSVRYTGCCIRPYCQWILQRIVPVAGGNSCVFYSFRRTTYLRRFGAGVSWYVDFSLRVVIRWFFRNPEGRNFTSPSVGSLRRRRTPHPLQSALD